MWDLSILFLTTACGSTMISKSVIRIKRTEMGLSIENGRDGPVCCAALGSITASHPALGTQRRHVVYARESSSLTRESLTRGRHPHPALLAGLKERQGGETDEDSLCQL